VFGCFVLVRDNFIFIFHIRNFIHRYWSERNI